MSAFKRYWYPGVACCLVLVLSVTALVYWGGLHGPFVLDDQVNIETSYVQNFAWDEIIYEATHNTSGRLGRPVSVLSFIASGLLHGPDTWGYKFHNLMLHLLNGLLLFWLFGKILTHINSKLTPQTAWIVAGTAAACWLLHPLMVSTVLYAVQRMAQLSAFFTLASLLVYFFARESVGRGFVRYYGLGFVLFPFCLLLAVFSKEDGALIVFYILALEGIVFGFKVKPGREKFRVIMFQTLFAIVPIILAALYVLTHLEQFTSYANRDFNVLERVMSQLHILVFYLKLILLPVVSEMSLFHDSWPVVRQVDFLTVVFLIFWIGAFVLIFACRKKAPVLSFGIAWFLISHLMESSIFGLELVFEHRNYLAAAGLLLVVFYYMCSCASSKFLKIVPVAVIALLAFMTNGRVMEWKNDYTFHTLAINDHPNSYRANISYANYQLSLGNQAEAVKYLEIAQEINRRDYGPVLHQLAMKCNSAETSSKLYQKAIERAEQYPATIYVLHGTEQMVAMLNRGECSEITRDQILHLVQIALMNEDTKKIARYTGFLQRQEGLLYLMNGDIGKGIDALTEAYNNTKEFSILIELVEVLIRLGQIESVHSTMGLLEEVNRQSWGIESIKIEQLKEKIAAEKSQQEIVQ